MAARTAIVADGRPKRPVVVKIAPDIAEADLPAIAERLVAHGVDGIAVGNTTLSRPASLRETQRAREAGGLSGRPLFRRSTAMLARVFVATHGRIPLIGIGGIDSPERALAKVDAGASLLQLYTGLVFQGPGLIARIKTHLAAAAEAAGAASVAELAGRRAEAWAAMPLEA
jgi:dihydroorotate dehydrogenase